MPVSVECPQTSSYVMRFQYPLWPLAEFAYLYRRIFSLIESAAGYHRNQTITLTLSLFNSSLKFYPNHYFCVVSYQAVAAEFWFYP